MTVWDKIYQNYKKILRPFVEYWTIIRYYIKVSC
jgi:hypothetical protein